MPPNEIDDQAVIAAIERLDENDAHKRKSSRWLILALTTALGGAGTTGVRAFVDSDAFDELRGAVAAHVVTADTREEHATKERDRLIEQVGALRETVAALRATVEIMAASRRTYREAIEGVTLPPPMEPAPRAKSPKPKPAAIKAVRAELFSE